MRNTRTLLLAGLATIGIAGAALAAGEARLHTLDVALPDGSIAHIRYAGDVAPKVVVQPAAVEPVAMLAEDPFAEIDRIAAVMDAQSDAAFARANAMRQAAQAGDAQAHAASAGAAPNGSYSYTYVSTTGAGAKGACTQSYRMTAFAPDKAPQVETQQSGDCKGVAPLVPAAMTGQPPARPQAAPTVAPKPAPARPDLRGTI